MAQAITDKIRNLIYRWECKLFPIDMEKVYVDQAGVNRLRYKGLQITSFYLPEGIRQLDSEYSRRIMSHREDTKNLRKEIKSNPHLHRKIKRNLLFNLRTYELGI